MTEQTPNKREDGAVIGQQVPLHLCNQQNKLPSDATFLPSRAPEANIAIAEAISTRTVAEAQDEAAKIIADAKAVAAQIADDAKAAADAAAAVDTPVVSQGEFIAEHTAAQEKEAEEQEQKGETGEVEETDTGEMMEPDTGDVVNYDHDEETLEDQGT